VQNHRDSRFGNLPGRFRAGEAGADNMHGLRVDLMPVMAREVARFQARGMRKATRCRRFGVCQFTSAGYDNARSEAGVSVSTVG